MTKYKAALKARAPMSGIELTGGRFARAFENNIGFLKGFDIDRILYWYRVHAGKRAKGAPYADDSGHFENNLKGQTAGEFLMGACTTLLWKEDDALRSMVRTILREMEECRDSDGFIIPIPREEFATKEYPNYTRAWITFGLLDAGFSGEQAGFRLARDMTDWFNHSDVLPYVKDMNLGFQGILANTRVYTSPVGKDEDIQVAVDHYQETWWLKQVISGDHRAIYDHPGNHPHSTLLTTLEGYFDLYRATGDEIYINAVRSALKMYEDKWQHVGGGINMCEHDNYYPGCNWLSPSHNYNELCSTNFWVLLNQRMHLLEPMNAHYVDEMETSLYNVLLAAQAGTTGYHYLNYLEKHKDWRYLDRCTCCASLGTRLAGLLPQFLYTYDSEGAFVDIFAPSRAVLPMCTLRTETDIPDGGHVRITVEKAEKSFTLRIRKPRWACGDGRSHYMIYENVFEGDVFEYDFPMSFRMTKYTGGEEIPGRDRWAMEYGPLLYAALGAPTPVHLSWDPLEPDDHLIPADDGKPGFFIKGDNCHEYRAYTDIGNEPFSVYPVFDTSK